MKKILAVLVLCSAVAVGQTTIRATNIFTKNVTAEAGGGAGIDFRNGNHTMPYKVGLIAGLPANCTVGERYFATNAATVGQNSYSCTSLNTWTLDFGSGIVVSTGTVDFGSAGHTIPSKKGLAAARPSPCSDGEEYFATDATAGRNKYYCVGNVWTQQLGSSGTVTSAAMTVPAFMAVSGSPITTTGTFVVTMNNQNQNLFLAGPGSGAAATPTFRAILALDLGTGTADSSTVLGGDLVFRQYPRVLDKQDVVAGAAGDGTDKTIYTYSMPSGTVASGKCVRITYYLQRTAGAGNPTFKISFGATAVASYAATIGAGPIWIHSVVCNNAASTTAQWGFSNQQETTSGSNSTTTTPAENTNSGSPIVIKGTFNVSAATSAGGKGWLVELLP